MQNFEEDHLKHEKLLYSSYFAGLAQSTTSVGIIHAISHVISPKVKLSHGHINSLLIPHVIRLYHDKGVDILSFNSQIGFKNIDESVSFFQKIADENNICLISKNSLTIDEKLINEIRNDMCFKTSPILLNDDEVKNLLEKIID